jgi:hypothetical protein
MTRVWRGAGVAALVGAMSWVLSTSNADDKDLTIKEIMGKAHKGPNSLIMTVGKDLKADEPDWADVEKKSKELVRLGTALGKNEPPKGEKASWQKLTQRYVTNAKALEKAAEDKDKSKALAAHKKLTGMCMACHSVHKSK